jgi:hypothetical protein
MKSMMWEDILKSVPRSNQKRGGIVQKSEKYISFLIFQILKKCPQIPAVAFHTFLPGQNSKFPLKFSIVWDKRRYDVSGPNQAAGTSCCGICFKTC